MIKRVFLVLCSALMFQNVVFAGEGEGRFLTLNYDVLSEGEDVGDITFNVSRTENGYVIVTHNYIKASGWWGDINVTTMLSEEFQYGVGLVKSDGKTVDSDTVYWSRIDVYENDFLGTFTEIPKVSHYDITNFLASNEVKQKHRVKFTRGSFGMTLNNFPFYIQKNSDKPLPKKVQILDSENLKIIHISIKDLGMKKIWIGRQEISVRHLILFDETFTPSNIWIKIDSTSLPYMVRHTGEDEEGAFEIILKPFK